MAPTLIPRPDCSQESVAASEYTSTQIFEVMYIILTGLIDSMVPSSSPWAILRKFLSHIGLQAVWLQVLRNLLQDESLTAIDASKFVIASVLLQTSDDGLEYLVGYF
ncbi:hypothetical protein DSO57_1036825 [Entomophthora muscae]|uniref:Uncharacterized protein n=1 Tax=Entomophthora muscae TaxID=34485 RepID=A0ACC2UJ13_9FUNG|nr:hypothetical protein DSO57_1036825 [Entomophthora muscae]